MSALPDIQFTTKDGITQILIDGKEIRGCVHAEFVWDIKEPPKVEIVMMAQLIKVSADEAKIDKKEDETHE